MKIYQIRQLSRLSTEDDFKRGEIGSTHDDPINVDFAADSVTALFEQIADFFIIAPTDILLHPDDSSRIDFSRLEDSNGIFVTPTEIELWKGGRLRLWAARYTAYVETVTPTNLHQEIPAHPKG